MISKIILSVMAIVFISLVVTNYSGKLAVISIIGLGEFHLVNVPCDC